MGVTNNIMFFGDCGWAGCKRRTMIFKAFLDLDAVHLSFNVEEDKNCVKEGLMNRLV
jgi:hypothetical protein